LGNKALNRWRYNVVTQSISGAFLAYDRPANVCGRRVHDLVGELIRLAIEAAPEAAPALHRIEWETRAAWGGERVYICKATAECKAGRLGAAIASGQPLRQAINELGISYSTAHRLLGRKAGT
jgi:hypothetical protein